MRAPKVIVLMLFGVVVSAAGCTDGPEPPAPPPCDQKCVDGTSLRAVREMLKLVFNLTLQGKPVGHHDQRIPCIRGGTAHIFGDASSNAIQGATEVNLTYELDKCAYVESDTEANENYDITVTGTITQRGTIAVQPSATTALIIKSEKVSFSGSVYSPSVPVDEKNCNLEILQDGNRVAGTLCTRVAGFDF